MEPGLAPAYLIVLPSFALDGTMTGVAVFLPHNLRRTLLRPTLAVRRGNITDLQKRRIKSPRFSISITRKIAIRCARSCFQGCSNALHAAARLESSFVGGSR